MSQPANISSAMKCKNVNDIPSKRLTFNALSGEFVQRNNSEPFLKGPIPIAWLARAAMLPGKTFAIAVAVQWLHGMNQNTPFKLTKKSLEYFCVSASAATDALNRLEANGLVKLTKKHGRRATIEVLSVNTDL